MTLRAATEHDIPALAVHHRKMFEEIWSKKGDPLDDLTLDRLENSYIKKLQAQFQDKTCQGWVIEDNDTLVASGAVTIISLVPNPVDLSHEVAFFHSMYTEKDYRNRKYAHAIIEQAIQYCKQKGLRRIMLTTSETGRPIYQNLGFCPVPDFMRLIIK